MLNEYQEAYSLCIRHFFTTVNKLLSYKNQFVYRLFYFKCTNRDYYYNELEYQINQIDAIQFHAIQSDAIQFDAVKFDAVQFDAVQFDAIKSDAIQFYAVQFDAIQFHAIQFSMSMLNHMRYKVYNLRITIYLNTY